MPWAYDSKWILCLLGWLSENFFSWPNCQVSWILVLKMSPLPWAKLSCKFLRRHLRGQCFRILLSSQSKPHARFCTCLLINESVGQNSDTCFHYKIQRPASQRPCEWQNWLRSVLTKKVIERTLVSEKDKFGLKSLLHHCLPESPMLLLQRVVTAGRACLTRLLL